MFYSRKRQRLLGRMAFILRRLSRGGTGQDDVWSDRDHLLLMGFFFSTVSRIWNLLLQDVLPFFPGSFRISLFIDLRCTWDLRKRPDCFVIIRWWSIRWFFLSVTSFMSQHANVKSYNVIFTLSVVLLLFVVKMPMPNTVFVARGGRLINWVRGFSQFFSQKF